MINISPSFELGKTLGSFFTFKIVEPNSNA